MSTTLVNVWKNCIWYVTLCSNFPASFVLDSMHMVSAFWMHELSYKEWVIDNFLITDVSGKTFTPAIDDNGHVDVFIQDVKIHPSKNVNLEKFLFS